MHLNRALTRIVQAVNWWLAGFGHLVPQRLQKLATPGSNRVLLTLSEGTLLCQCRKDYEQGVHDEQAFPLATPELTVPRIAGWLDEHSNNHTELVYLVPSARLLHKALTLPAAARNDLGQILQFEMDRYTPFSNEQVYFDYIVKEDEAAEGRIAVDLYLAQKDPVDQDIEQLMSLNLRPDRISGQNGNEQLLPVNLIPKMSRKEASRLNYPITWALTGLACLLYIASLVLPIQVRQSQIETLEAELASLRSDALQVQALIKERDALLARSSFIAEKQSEHIPAIVLVNELTELLPDDTWLQRLVIKPDEIQLLGESDNASSLITLLENSDYLQAPAFRSPVTRNQATQKDKFQLIARLGGGT